MKLSGKNSLQFPEKMREYFEQNCGFTDEEKEILRLRGRGFTTLQISMRMDEKYGYYYERKVERRLSSIREKIRSIM